MSTERRPILDFRAVSTQWLPFADAATAELPMSRLLRLSLFQLSVGMAAVMLIGTLNRVMIVELAVPTTLVAIMLSLPLLFAPLRALIGFRSDHHRSALGWRRVPYLWMGTIIQFGGLAMMPFALIVLSGDSTGPEWAGWIGAGCAFLMVGAGMHMVQTVGLALATDLAPREVQPKVVAFLSVMLLAGMLVSSIVLGALLTPFSQLQLIQVIQGTAIATLAINLVAVWKQEPRNPARTAGLEADPSFLEAWRELRREGKWGRRLVALGLGTMGFTMQDVLLEPYGGQILGLPVGATTGLTALFAAGGIAGFVHAARVIGRGADANRIAGFGAAWGALGFGGVVIAAPTGSVEIFALSVAVIGFGGGLFAHGTLTACMQAAPPEQVGLALGAWGAVQASCAGVAIALSGVLRDLLAGLAAAEALGPVLTGPEAGYVAVYLIEILLLFATLAAIGPLVRIAVVGSSRQSPRPGLLGPSHQATPLGANSGSR
jgi:BCD family chlorophyll transporter-like MFS transporter